MGRRFSDESYKRQEAYSCCNSSLYNNGCHFYRSVRLVCQNGNTAHLPDNLHKFLVGASTWAVYFTYIFLEPVCAHRYNLPIPEYWQLVQPRFLPRDKYYSWRLTRSPK